MKKLISVLGGLFLAVSYMGCAPAKPRYFDIQPQEKIAIGQFAMNGVVTIKGEKREGPGMLQDKEAFYKYPQKAIDSAAQIFFAELPTSLGDVQVIPLAEMSANAGYQRASRPSEIKMLGISQSESDGDVYPDVVGYTNPQGKENKVDALMMALGVDAMLFLSFDVNMVKAADSTVVSAEVGILKVSSSSPVVYYSVETKVNAWLYRKGKGQVWSKSYVLTGKEKASLFGLLVTDNVNENFPRQFVSSIEALPEILSAELQTARDRPEAAASNSASTTATATPPPSTSSSAVESVPAQETTPSSTVDAAPATETPSQATEPASLSAPAAESTPEEAEPAAQ
ncbi:MAG TPA: hypothetical protein VLM37_09130 [Fibrobacteraceae bacterium]|nr:hypothetical protein [Fibrobacteraceae bacterium]